MSREEAIGTMNYLKHYAETDIKERDVLEEKDRVRFIEAVEMAIKALSQEPCDDAIRREAVKKWICKTCPDDSECQRDCDFIKGIDALPPVTPQQKYGKWIIKEDNTSYVKTIPRRWAECSCCKWSMSPGYVDRYAFCPHCGCRMVEPQESE